MSLEDTREKLTGIVHELREVLSGIDTTTLPSIAIDRHGQT